MGVTRNPQLCQAPLGADSGQGRAVSDVVGAQAPAGVTPHHGLGLDPDQGGDPELEEGQSAPVGALEVLHVGDRGLVVLDTPVGARKVCGRDVGVELQGVRDGVGDLADRVDERLLVCGVTGGPVRAREGIGERFQSHAGLGAVGSESGAAQVQRLECFDSAGVAPPEVDPPLYAARETSAYEKSIP